MHACTLRLALRGLRRLGNLAALGALALPVASHAQRFTVTDTSVRQGRFQAVALSRDTIVSSYPRAAREVRFRFSINGLENEFPPGTEHTIYLRPVHGRLVTPLYRFGDESEPPPPTPDQSASSEDGVARVTFRVDLRRVLRDMATTGTFRPSLGAPIHRGETLHVYVLGDPAPLTWDYRALTPGSPLELTDSDRDGVYEGTVAIPTAYTRPRLADGRAVWARTADLSAYPTLVSSQRIQDAAYRLSLEELHQLVRPDGALAAGAKWPGVWTRDVSLSAILSLAIVAPDAVKRSLLAKVDSSGRIIQDTGTGGSWPVSTDRMVWALAAREVYEVTGDRAWLAQAYDIIRRSALADLHAVRDRETGLFNGESSFMDWREQSYPRWMQPADIHASQSLSTNAIHYGAYRTLAAMARELGESPDAWDAVAADLQHAMTTHLWQPDRGWFAEYRYGRVYRALSPRTESLGQALAMLYGAASSSQRRTLSERMPVTAFGAPSFWPFTPNERLYHNATIWPFVTAYWTWASADAGNTLATRRGLDDATRTTALFLTNKENTVAATGHYEGTALNSDRQLWSVAGTLASTYRVLFGIRLEPNGLVLRPMVPPSCAGDRTLGDLHYRKSLLRITIHGHGNAVASARLDGRSVAAAVIPASLEGPHTLELFMNGQWPASTVQEVPSRFAPATPVARLGGDTLRWSAVRDAAAYVVYRDGHPVGRTRRTEVAVAARDGLDEYQVLAVGADGDESFLGEPLRVLPRDAERLVPVDAASCERDETAGATGCYARLTTTRHTHLSVSPSLGAGRWVLDLHYANGNGPVNTEDKVAVRTLQAGDTTVGVFVLPQRGSGRWADWGWSNGLRVPPATGPRGLALDYTPLDANMNGRENTALLDAWRFTRLATDSATPAPSARRPPSRMPR